VGGHGFYCVGDRNDSCLQENVACLNALGIP
jgi:hypothetical protein